MKRVDIEVPRDDGEVLVVPALRELPGLVRANRRLIEGYAFTFCGRSAGAFRDAARAEIMSAAREYTASLGVRAPAGSAEPVVMTGHQPEFYHPGVWVKNHLAARLAEAVGGVGLNLVVDNDVPREGDLALPVYRHGRWTRHHLHFADVDPSRAWEEHTDKTSWRFDRLTDEVNDLLRLDEEPFIARLMAGAADCTRAAANLAHLMTLLRRRCEETIGLGNLEVPASVMSDTMGFALFVLGIAADARGFAGTYNAAVREYRRVHGIRSESHPVPELAIEGTRVELPFWVWAPGGPRRRLWLDVHGGPTLRMDGDAVWTIDERTWRAMLAGDARAFDAAAEGMLAEGRGRFKVRPRAISNTLFARMFLSDVFVHGVGGAKYDAITDEIVRRFFHVEPPGFVTCSATLYLPIDVEGSRRDDLRRLRWELRDSLYNADRHMDGKLRRSAPVEKLVAEKRALVERSENLRARSREVPRPYARRERREIFLDIRRHNEGLAALIEPKRRALREEIARVESHAGDEDVVKDRGYAFVLYPAKQLLDFYAAKLDMDRGSLSPPGDPLKSPLPPGEG